MITFFNVGWGRQTLKEFLIKIQPEVMGRHVSTGVNMYLRLPLQALLPIILHPRTRD